MRVQKSFVLIRLMRLIAHPFSVRTSRLAGNHDPIEPSLMPLDLTDRIGFLLEETRLV